MSFSSSSKVWYRVLSRGMCNRCFSASFPSSSLNAWLFNTSPVNSTVFMALIIFINNCSFSTESPQQRWLPAVERWITGIKWLPAGLNFTTRPASSGAEEIEPAPPPGDNSHQKGEEELRASPPVQNVAPDPLPALLRLYLTHRLHQKVYPVPKYIRYDSFEIPTAPLKIIS